MLNAPELGIVEAWFLLSFLKSTEAYKSLAKDLDWQKLDGILNQLYSTNEIKEIENNDPEF